MHFIGTFVNYRHICEIKYSQGEYDVTEAYSKALQEKLSAYGLLLVFLQLRQILLDVADTGCIARVCTHELRNRSASVGRHLLPEGDGCTWIITCHGHEDEAHVVGFCFMLAREGESYSILGTESVDGASCLLDGSRFLAQGLGKDLCTVLCHQLLAHALVAMLGYGMGHFVTYHNRLAGAGR